MRKLIFFILIILSKNIYGQTNSELNSENDSIKYYKSLPEVHKSLIAGIWIPTGDLKILGSHPELGFQIGTKRKKMNYDLIMVFKFIKSANNYYAYRFKNSSTPEITDKFFGGHMGLNIGRDILVKNGHEIQFISGIAFDGFDALEKDRNNNFDARSTKTYNLNVGLNYRFYFTDSFYLGMRAKYNFIDYSLNNVVRYNGNVVSIHFMIGGVNNLYRNENLRRLNVKVRK